MQDTIEDIHAFWFGALDEQGLCSAQQHSLWFKRSDDTDEIIRQCYTGLLQRAASGELDHWAESDDGLMALVVLLDQFSRNIHRDSALAFATDPQALAIALAAIAEGRHQHLPLIHRVFLYLPLEHSEDLSLQEQCVVLFQDMQHESGDARVTDFARYAIAHRDVIARFGRFPHRNEALGRTSTEQELDYLVTHGGF